MPAIYKKGVKYAGTFEPEVEPVRLTQAQYDALTPAQKLDTSKIYYIVDSPAGSRTDGLNATFVTIFNTHVIADGSYALSDPITDYDILLLGGYNNYNTESGVKDARIEFQTLVIYKSDFFTRASFKMGSLVIDFPDSEHINITGITSTSTGPNRSFDNVYGIKLNKSSQGESEGTIVIANPLGDPSETLSTIQIGNIIYDMSGNTVEANPEGEPTDTIKTLRIGRNIFDIFGSGSGGGSGSAGLTFETILETSITSNTTVEISKSIEDYDALLVVGYDNYASSSERNQWNSVLIYKDDYYPNLGSGTEIAYSHTLAGYSSRRICFGFPDTTHIKTIGRSTSSIEKIYGIKSIPIQTVIPNPVPYGAPDADLQTVQIGSDLYNVGGGGGGGGTSDLDAVELTQSEYDELTIEEKTDPDKIYFIKDTSSVPVIVTPILQTGVKIAEITVDGVTQSLYAPAGGGSRQIVQDANFSMNGVKGYGLGAVSNTVSSQIVE